MKLFVTGHDTDGTSTFLHEQEVAPTRRAAFPHLLNVPLWEAPALLKLPFTGDRSALGTFFPKDGEIRFFYLTIGPDSAAQHEPTAEELAEFDRAFPGLLSAYEPDVPGMHTTDTIDFISVLSGRIVLELGEGIERTLEAGDALVQHGARHRWRNDFDVPASLVVFMAGVSRS